MLKKFLSLFLSLVLLIGVVPLSGLALALEDTETDSVYVEVADDSEEVADSEAGNQKEPVVPSSAYAPEGYQLIDSMDELGVMPFALNDPSLPRVLLIQDTLPWSSNANEMVLRGLGIAYDKTTTQNFITNVELEQYGVVIFANDQPFSTYENYNEFKGYLERFAQMGGVIVFGACDNGWANGVLTADLPGGVHKSEMCSSHRNYISDNLHPIVTGELSDGTALLDEDLVNTYCSHTYFMEDTFPAGSRVILRDSTNGAPTLVEYPLENGRVIASGLTWEHAYDHVGRNIDGYVCGEYATKAMEDMFLYAIRVSNIQVEELHRLSEYRLEANAHYVIVSDSNNNTIKGAVVTVDDKEYTTDENGSVAITDFGKKTVRVSASGYQTLQLTYTLKERTARMFFLNKADTLQLPYITSIQDTVNEYDYMAQRVYYPEGLDQSISIKIDAEWQGKTPAEYILFQTDENGQTITKLVSSTGDFDVSPGQIFKPGYDVKARLYASDGTASKEIRTGIIIQENSADTQVGDIDNLTSFRLFEDTNATLNNGKATKILPSNWSIKVDALPVEFKKSYDPNDGSSTYKGLVGLKGGKWTNDLLDDESGEGEWWTFISEFEKAKELYSSRENLLEKYHNKMSDSKLTSQVKANLEAVGYFEVKVNAYGKIIKTSGGIIVKGSGSYTRGGTFAVGPIPVYYELGFGAKFDGKVGLKLTFDNRDAKLGLEGELKITVPDITFGGGVGVYGVAQAGVEGNGGLEVEVFPSWKGTLKAALSVKIKVLFLGEYKWQIGNGLQMPLWPNGKGRTYSLDDMYNMALAEDNVTISPVSDDYANKTTNWNGSATVLQDWVLPDTMPELVAADNQLIALFQSNVENQVKLVYSCYNGETWTEPQPVATDNTYDLYFQPVTAGNDVYVVWQKLSAAVDNDADVEKTIKDAASNSEIYVAKWDASSNSFGDAVRLTNNTTMDMLPRMAVNGSTIVAAWVNDPFNSVTGGSTSNSILYAANNGSGWSQPQSIASVQSSVSDLAVGFIGSNVVACYVMGDAVYCTISDHPLTSGESLENGVTYHNGAFYWCSDGIVYTYAGSDVLAVTSENMSISSNFRIVDGDKESIVWPVNEAERGVLYGSVNLGNHWSQPIELFSSEDYAISYYDAHLSQDGTWYALLNAVPAMGGEKTSLLFHKADGLCDVSLDYAYAQESDRQGNIQPVDIAVINLGDSTVTSLDVSIIGSSVSHSERLACSIEPGAKSTFTVDIDVSGITSETKLNVSVDAGNESDYTNNSYEAVIGYVDAGVDLEYYFSEDTIIVAAKVSNLGSLPVNASIKVIEDSESGIVLDMKNLGTLTSYEDVLYLYTFNVSEIPIMNQSSKNYVFRVDTLEGDYNGANNSEIAIIYNENDTPPSHTHTWDTMWNSDSDGHWHECTSAGCTIVSNSEKNGYAPHTSDDGKITTEPTSTTAGIRIYSCIICGYVMKTETIPATGGGGSGTVPPAPSAYPITITQPEHGTVEASFASAVAGSNVIITVTPDDGYVLGFLTVTDSNGKVVSVTDNGDGTYTFTMPQGGVTVNATFKLKPCDGGVDCPSRNYIDVDHTAWYQEGVDYAVANKLMGGKAEGIFDPKGITTRAEMVTILYRLDGEPAVTGDARFDDVPGGQWYSDAINWAAANEIVGGYGNGEFGPDDTITREQMAAIFYRYASYKGYDMTKLADLTGYADTDTVSDWAVTAMRWVVAEDIINVTSTTTLSPSGDSTRAQVATIFMRFGENIAK